jgi:hypothetical protein
MLLVVFYSLYATRPSKDVIAGEPEPQAQGAPPHGGARVFTRPGDEGPSA